MNQGGGAGAGPASSRARSWAVTASTSVPPWRRMRRLAASFTSGGAGALTGSSTISEAADAWLVQANARADAGSLAHSTLESYESAVRLVLKPVCGAVTLDQLTVGRCDRIIQSIMREGSLSKARKARAVLGLICGYAVRDDAIPRNPVRDVQRLPMPEKKTSNETPMMISGRIMGRKVIVRR